MDAQGSGRRHIDTKALCGRHDCRLVVQQYLGKPSGGGKSSKAWSWRCPFHGERHGTSFTAWQDGWSCFGRCHLSGDVIEFVKRMDRLSFLDACARLDGNLGTARVVDLPEAAQCFELPPDLWREAAATLVNEAHVSLFGSPAALDYLTRRRGLGEETIAAAKLGFLSGDYRCWLQRHGLLYQSGVSIPWFVGDQVSAVNVRRLLPRHDQGQVRYRQVKGSEKGVFLACQTVLDDRPLVIVESELDALLLKQVARDQFQAAALGGAGGRLPEQWLEWRLHPRVVTVQDKDEAGQKFTAYLREQWPDLDTIDVPEGKDIGEFWQLREHQAVYNVVMKGLERGFTA